MSRLPEQVVTLRPAVAADRDALQRVAERDSSSVPGGALHVAVVDGEIRAAVSVLDGRTIADPFHPTAWLVDPLQLRIAQLWSPGRRAAALRLPRPRLRWTTARLRPPAADGRSEVAPAVAELTRAMPNDRAGGVLAPQSEAT